MSDLITKLGIDWKLLLFQIINFLILLWVLKRYAYKPILNALESRRRKIAKSLEQAGRIEVESKQLQAEKEGVLKNARMQASAILEDARKGATEFLATSREQAKAEAAAMLVATRQEAERAKDEIVNSARADISDLVVSATAKVIRVKLDPATERRLIEDAVKSANLKEAP
ncbi:MAG: F0F1 ATP synthase subunit B [Candidatus Kerfeldbacteria bacterium]|nr:F0F1 ATP synthase subunit B [Candidatus Kerfeldbacteria bacterium]